MQISSTVNTPKSAFQCFDNQPRTSSLTTPLQETSNAVSALHAKFAEWNMSTIKQYMVEHSIYTEEEVDAAELEYKRWLSLAVAYMPKSVPISAKVDKFWHTHILFTEDYTAMSKSIVGHYLHHRPSILDNKQELRVSFGAETLTLYFQNFGEPNPVFWDSVLCKCGPTD